MYIDTIYSVGTIYTPLVAGAAPYVLPKLLYPILFLLYLYIVIINVLYICLYMYFLLIKLDIYVLN